MAAKPLLPPGGNKAHLSGVAWWAGGWRWLTTNAWAQAQPLGWGTAWFWTRTSRKIRALASAAILWLWVPWPSWDCTSHSSLKTHCSGRFQASLSQRPVALWTSGVVSAK